MTPNQAAMSCWRSPRANMPLTTAASASLKRTPLVSAPRPLIPTTSSSANPTYALISAGRLVIQSFVDRIGVSLDPPVENAPFGVNLPAIPSQCFPRRQSTERSLAICSWRFRTRSPLSVSCTRTLPIAPIAAITAGAEARLVSRCSIAGPISSVTAVHHSTAACCAWLRFSSLSVTGRVPYRTPPIPSTTVMHPPRRAAIVVTSVSEPRSWRRVSCSTRSLRNRPAS